MLEALQYLANPKITEKLAGNDCQYDMNILRLRNTQPDKNKKEN